MQGKIELFFQRKKAAPVKGRLSLLLLNGQVNQGIQPVSVGPLGQRTPLPRMVAETINLRKIRLILICPAFCFLRPVSGEPFSFDPDPARDGKECVRAFRAFYGANFTVRTEHSMPIPSE